MDNYIMLNGEKIELTDFQSGMLQMMVDDKKLGNRDIFDRVNKNEKYYFIAENGKVEEDEDTRDPVDDDLYHVASYCTDKRIITERSYDEVVNRLLWRYAYRANGGKLDPNGDGMKYTIIWNDAKNKFEPKAEPWNVSTQGAIYFKNLADAYTAIEGIIIPFCVKLVSGGKDNG